MPLTRRYFALWFAIAFAFTHGALAQPPVSPQTTSISAA